MDGLDIAGDIDDKRARAMEDLLWSLIPEARHLRENVGKFTDERKRRAMSRPLAPSRVPVTDHVVKAARAIRPSEESDR